MPQTRDIGTRIELVPMDLHFHEITIALYRQEESGHPLYRVHTYSSLPGAAGRIDAVVERMCQLGECQSTEAGLLHFPCGAAHQLACRRLFLEACKLPPGEEAGPRPLSVFDKKSSGQIEAISEGKGRYRLAADGEPDRQERRISTVSGGLVKLAEMVEQRPGLLSFSCGQVHDALVGLLLPRALNVRAILREQEQVAARGVLSAPSKQN